jgi:hypothetical protein
VVEVAAVVAAAVDTPGTGAEEGWSLSVWMEMLTCSLAFVILLSMFTFVGKYMLAARTSRHAFQLFR